MTVEKFTFNPFYTNCYLIIHNKKCIIIDPSCYFDNEKEKIYKYLKINNLKPILYIATHGHIDHIFGSKFLKEKFNIPFYAHKDEQDLINVSHEHSKYYFNLEMDIPPQVDNYIKEGDQINLDDEKIEIVEVPGHTVGHIALISRTLKAVFTGDTLFEKTIGRTDLPGGDTETLLRSIHLKILSLPDDFIVYPGHGNNTTIGDAKKYNPYIKYS